MKSINNKKGSHVGVVVSFVIFITFLVFLYTIIQPVTVRERDKQYILDYLTLNLMGDATGNMSTMIINVEEEVQPQTCLNVKDIIGDESDQIPEYMIDHLIFKTSEEKFTYERNSNSIRVNTGIGFIGIITVIYSESIVPLEYDGVPGCFPKNYPVGYVRTFSEIFETKIYELNESYYVSYEGLKAHLGLPPGTEFNFYIYDSKRSKPPIISAENYEPPTDRSVFVEEVPLQYVDEDGNIIFGFLLIKIW